MSEMITDTYVCITESNDAEGEDFLYLWLATDENIDALERIEEIYEELELDDYQFDFRIPHSDLEVLDKYDKNSYMRKVNFIVSPSLYSLYRDIEESYDLFNESNRKSYGMLNRVECFYKGGDMKLMSLGQMTSSTF